MPLPTISIIICTLNRAEWLLLALKSLERQHTDSHLFEILIIDNGSTDSTHQQLQPWIRENKIRYFLEKERGLSQARNRGWKEAKGEWIAYLDDDAVASPWWVSSYLTTINHFDSNVCIIGGKINLILPEPLPGWLPANFLGFLGELERGDRQRILSKDEWIGGGNSIYKRNALELAGGFPLSLGRKGGCLLSCEEIFLRRSIELSGYSCGYSPQALIWHYVHPDRLTKRWFLDRSFWQGVSVAKMDILLSPINKHKVLGKLFFTILSFIRYFGEYLLSFSQSPSNQFKIKCRLYSVMGRLRGLWRER